jgi:nucleotide-binding universal stress UspA family protein
MMKKAILATDLSRASDLLLDCHMQYKALGVEEIILFHVPTISFNYMEYSGYSMRVHIEARMINMTNKLKESGFKASFVFREGLPSQEIIDFANEHPGSLIIIGSKGQGFFKRNLIGSTTLRVIQQSRNPVLMVRVKNLGENPAGEVMCGLENKDITRKGLFLTDFSENAILAMKYAGEHLVNRLQNITIMHVQDRVIMKHHDPKTIEKFNEIDSRRMQELTIELRRKTPASVRCVLVGGAVVPEIMREVKQQDISLIVAGTHGKGYFTDMVLGSTVFAIIQLVETNCLLIPREQPSEEGLSTKEDHA